MCRVANSLRTSRRASTRTAQGGVADQELATKAKGRGSLIVDCRSTHDASIKKVRWRLFYHIALVDEAHDAHFSVASGQISGSVSTVTKEDDDHQFRNVPANAVAVGALLPGNLRARARDRPGVGDARLRQRLARRAPLLDLRL